MLLYIFNLFQTVFTMVRTYIRKKGNPPYTKDALMQAVEEVRSGNMSGYRAAKYFNIPRMTIIDHLKGRRGVKSSSFGRPPVLSIETEKKLADLLHIMERNGFGLSRKEVVELVANYIICNNIQTPFKNGIPGKDWVSNFIKRNNMSIKKPQAVEYSRKKVCDPFIIQGYFDMLHKVLTDLDIGDKPHRIWNMDETSFSNDPRKTKVVGLKGYAATRTTSSSGRENTSVLITCNANGDKGPPLIIYKGKNVWNEWISKDAYPGTVYAASKNGWMQTNIFENYFKNHFIPLTKNEKTLLIYDGHTTHISLSLIELAKNNDITIIKLPPHSSHLLQPLDLAIFKPFKDMWDEAILKWQKKHMGSKLPKKEFASMLGDIWQRIKPQTIKKGFEKSGISPFNNNVIPEDKYDPLALSKWKQYKKSVERKNPPTLLQLCLKVLNCYINTNSEEVRQAAVVKPMCPINTNKKINVLEAKILRDEEIMSFQDLLLNTVKRVDLIKGTKTKISKGADVITHDEYVEKLRLEEAEKKRKETIKKYKIKKRTQKDKKGIRKKNQGK